MSSCCGNYKCGHGGFGGGNSRGQGKTNPRTSHTKKTVEGYLFYMGSSKHVLYNEITAEFIVNHINKTFD